jgi:hypothetical protein
MTTTRSLPRSLGAAATQHRNTAIASPISPGSKSDVESFRSFHAEESSPGDSHTSTASSADAKMPAIESETKPNVPLVSAYAETPSHEGTESIQRRSSFRKLSLSHVPAPSKHEDRWRQAQDRGHSNQDESSPDSVNSINHDRDLQLDAQAKLVEMLEREQEEHRRLLELEKQARARIGSSDDAGSTRRPDSTTDSLGESSDDLDVGPIQAPVHQLDKDSYRSAFNRSYDRVDYGLKAMGNHQGPRSEDSMRSAFERSYDGVDHLYIRAHNLLQKKDKFLAMASLSNATDSVASADSPIADCSSRQVSQLRSLERDSDEISLPPLPMRRARRPLKADPCSENMSLLTDRPSREQLLENSESDSTKSRLRKQSFDSEDTIRTGIPPLPLSDDLSVRGEQDSPFASPENGPTAAGGGDIDSRSTQSNQHSGAESASWKSGDSQDLHGSISTRSWRSQSPRSQELAAISSHDGTYTEKSWQSKSSNALSVTSKQSSQRGDKSVSGNWQDSASHGPGVERVRSHSWHSRQSEMSEGFPPAKNHDIMSAGTCDSHRMSKNNVHDEGVSVVESWRSSNTAADHVEPRSWASQHSSIPESDRSEERDAHKNSISGSWQESVAQNTERRVVSISRQSHLERSETPNSSSSKRRQRLSDHKRNDESDSHIQRHQSPVGNMPDNRSERSWVSEPSRLSSNKGEKASIWEGQSGGVSVSESWQESVQQSPESVRSWVEHPQAAFQNESVASGNRGDESVSRIESRKCRRDDGVGAGSETSWVSEGSRVSSTRELAQQSSESVKSWAQCSQVASSAPSIATDICSDERASHAESWQNHRGDEIGARSERSWVSEPSTASSNRGEKALTIQRDSTEASVSESWQDSEQQSPQSVKSWAEHTESASCVPPMPSVCQDEAKNSLAAREKPRPGDDAYTHLERTWVSEQNQTVLEKCETVGNEVPVEQTPQKFRTERPCSLATDSNELDQAGSQHISSEQGLWNTSSRSWRSNSSHSKLGDINRDTTANQSPISVSSLSSQRRKGCESAEGFRNSRIFVESLQLASQLESQSIPENNYVDDRSDVQIRPSSPLQHSEAALTRTEECSMRQEESEGMLNTGSSKPVVQSEYISDEPQVPYHQDVEASQCKSGQGRDNGSVLQAKSWRSHDDDAGWPGSKRSLASDRNSMASNRHQENSIPPQQIDLVHIISTLTCQDKTFQDDLDDGVASPESWQIKQNEWASTLSERSHVSEHSRRMPMEETGQIHADDLSFAPSSPKSPQVWTEATISQSQHLLAAISHNHNRVTSQSLGSTRSQERVDALNPETLPGREENNQSSRTERSSEFGSAESNSYMADSKTSSYRKSPDNANRRSWNSRSSMHSAVSRSDRSVQDELFDSLSLFDQRYSGSTSYNESWCSELEEQINICERSQLSANSEPASKKSELETLDQRGKLETPSEIMLNANSPISLPKDQSSPVSECSLSEPSLHTSASIQSVLSEDHDSSNTNPTSERSVSSGSNEEELLDLNTSRFHASHEHSLASVPKETASSVASQQGFDEVSVLESWQNSQCNTAQLHETLHSNARRDGRSVHDNGGEARYDNDMAPSEQSRASENGKMDSIRDKGLAAKSWPHSHHIEPEIGIECLLKSKSNDETGSYVSEAERLRSGLSQADEAYAHSESTLACRSVNDNAAAFATETRRTTGVLAESDSSADSFLPSQVSRPSAAMVDLDVSVRPELEIRPSAVEPPYSPEGEYFSRGKICLEDKSSSGSCPEHIQNRGDSKSEASWNLRVHSPPHRNESEAASQDRGSVDTFSASESWSSGRHSKAPSQLLSPRARSSNSVPIDRSIKSDTRSELSSHLTDQRTSKLVSASGADEFTRHGQDSFVQNLQGQVNGVGSQSSYSQETSEAYAGKSVQSWPSSNSSECTPDDEYMPRGNSNSSFSHGTGAPDSAATPSPAGVSLNGHARVAYSHSSPSVHSNEELPAGLSGWDESTHSLELESGAGRYDSPSQDECSQISACKAKSTEDRISYNYQEEFELMRKLEHTLSESSKSHHDGQKRGSIRNDGSRLETKIMYHQSPGCSVVSRDRGISFDLAESRCDELAFGSGHYDDLSGRWEHRNDEGRAVDQPVKYRPFINLEDQRSVSSINDSISFPESSHPDTTSPLKPYSLRLRAGGDSSLGRKESPPSTNGSDKDIHKEEILASSSNKVMDVETVSEYSSHDSDHRKTGSEKSLHSLRTSKHLASSATSSVMVSPHGAARQIVHEEGSENSPSSSIGEKVAGLHGAKSTPSVCSHESKVSTYVSPLNDTSFRESESRNALTESQSDSSQSRDEELRQESSDHGIESISNQGEEDVMPRQEANSPEMSESQCIGTTREGDFVDESKAKEDSNDSNQVSDYDSMAATLPVLNTAHNELHSHGSFESSGKFSGYSDIAINDKSFPGGHSESDTSLRESQGAAENGKFVRQVPSRGRPAQRGDEAYYKEDSISDSAQHHDEERHSAQVFYESESGYSEGVSVSGSEQAMAYDEDRHPSSMRSLASHQVAKKEAGYLHEESASESESNYGEVDQGEASSGSEHSAPLIERDEPARTPGERNISRSGMDSRRLPRIKYGRQSKRSVNTVAPDEETGLPNSRHKRSSRHMIDDYAFQFSGLGLPGRNNLSVEQEKPGPIERQNDFIYVRVRNTKEWKGKRNSTCCVLFVLVLLSAVITGIVVGTRNKNDVEIPVEPTASPTQIISNREWDLLGDAIVGDEDTDQTGFSVSISGDGMLLAIGARRHSKDGIINRGNARVYRYMNESEASSPWSMVADFYGNNEKDQLGFAVNLSGDGKRLAVSSIGSDDSGKNSGLVQVYEEKESTWELIGELTGESVGGIFGVSVSLSFDGHFLAVGSPYHTTDGLLRNGRVYFFEDIGFADWSNWQPSRTALSGTAANDWFGWSVSLSDDGTRLAVGAPLDPERTEDSGYVKVYQAVGSDTWQGLGAPLTGSPGERFGYSVSLAKNSTRVGVGAYRAKQQTMPFGKAFVYTNVGDSWNLVGEALVGDQQNANFGFSVSLSDNGDFFAVGAPNYNATKGSGLARVYQYLATGEWVASPDITSESDSRLGFSLSLSSDAGPLAVGLPLANQVRVYENDNE